MMPLMNPVTDILIHLPQGWWLIPLGGAVFVAILFFLWRRRSLGLMALASVLAALLIMFCFLLTWKTEYNCGMAWETQKPPFAAVRFVNCHGKMLCMLDLQHEGHPAPGYGAFVVSHTPNQVSSVLAGRKYSLLCKWPFIEDKIGFQLAHFHGGTLDSYSMTMPHWLVILLFCPWFPLLWYLRRRRHLRQRGFPVTIDSQSTPSTQTPPPQVAKSNPAKPT
jgi:hypothetical protein